MKNFSLFIISIFCYINVSAQIYIGENIHEKNNKRSYSVLTSQSEKDLTTTLDKFLSQYGKINKPEKNIYRLKNSSLKTISSDLSYIDAIAKSTKSMSKVEFFFLNDANNALSDYELNKNGAEDFVNSFIDFLNKKIEDDLINQNIELAESDLKEVLKNQSKIRKAIENNLKTQQKLGKQLDASPELIAEAMSEKDDINSLLSDSSLDSLDDKTVSKLEKSSQKKEKEIAKIEKKAKKAEQDLANKEEELISLKREMAETRNLVTAYQKVLVDAKSFLNK